MTGNGKSSENSELVDLRHTLYSLRLRGEISRVEWGRILDAQTHQTCVDYVVQHSPAASADEIRDYFAQWLDTLQTDIPAHTSRRYQVRTLKAHGFTSRQIAGLLKISRTRVREVSS